MLLDNHVGKCVLISLIHCKHDELILDEFGEETDCRPKLQPRKQLYISRKDSKVLLFWRVQFSWQSRTNQQDLMWLIKIITMWLISPILIPSCHWHHT